MVDIDYDIGIVGAGLAGLTTAIQLRKRGYSVVIFEKNSFPFHRVCGEYISLESWDYLVDCGIELAGMTLPVIKNLQVSTLSGILLNTGLDLGGFGISRYTIDGLLAMRAREVGVEVQDNCKVDHMERRSNYYLIHSPTASVRVRMAIGAFGKRSNIDVYWKRDFISRKPNALNNYIGIKYHIKTDFPDDTIALHNFKNGYCGISKIEDNKYCLCYLTTASNLQDSGSIKEMEQQFLYKNTYLRQLFEQSEFQYNQPLSISQISFDTKEPVFARTPLIGDTCGMITPLCGNGMSMAMHSGKLLTQLVDKYLQKQLSLDGMLAAYVDEWKKQFAVRLQAGRFVQRQLGKEWRTNLFISLLKKFPAITNRIIEKTHGKNF
ncbi:NAD(P)/FAD-dependent oxidoreductase [Sphingobacterium gobiense]|uniref:Pyridine nucleotide-disulfide oxidoreductase n=1 Tax=Sphingobacterium gobiense TaxID=1382456 RepID=A0A2S9JMX2_9SPHI|nr:NAD(P)/FAD-dependent oxidoreductase [Sphingobacterium gobiense]PRD54515.1 pyridine nucleotide-disulfide oxidoreductase [Sphingobacterium gobiense]